MRFGSNTHYQGLLVTFQVAFIVYYLVGFQQVKQ